MEQPLLKVAGVSKSYGSVRALDGVSISFQPGEVHAVLGQNGAGKSTLMGVLSGFVLPDSGTVEMEGISIPLGRPFDIKRLGIEMVHQHFTLVPELTVAENLSLARIGNLYTAHNSWESSQSTIQIAKTLGWDIDPGARVADLSVGTQQRLEILKGLAGDAKVIILDEPTAVLSPSEVEDLFLVLTRLAHQGTAVVLIAHKLNEVMAVADRVSVLRSGALVASDLIGNVNPKLLAEWMVGRMPDALERGASTQQAVLAKIKDLKVRGNRGEEAVRGVTLQICRGEILGIGGVDGNGQIELGEALAFVRPRADGYTELDVDQLRVGYIPQDRQSEGLALKMSVKDNLLIGDIAAQTWFLAPKRITVWANSIVEKFHITAGGLDVPVGSLSGGNQQKIVVGRTLASDPDLLVIVNPTRGLDIEATHFVHEQILAAKSRGAAVVLFSTDLDELAALCDRTLFMSRGCFVEGLGATDLVGGTT